jgi:hypothetical protein
MKEQESKKSANNKLPGLCADTQRYNKLSTFLQIAPTEDSTSSKSLEFLSRHKPHKTHKGTCFYIRKTGPRPSKVPQPLNKSTTLLGITHSTPPQTSYKNNSKQPEPHHNEEEGDQRTSHSY